MEIHKSKNSSPLGKLDGACAFITGATSGIGKATALRAFQELEDKGFIVLMRQGNWYHRAPNEWRLTHKPMETARGRTPPTMDWRQYQPPKKPPKKPNCGSDTDPSGLSVVPFQNPKARRGSV